MMLHNRLTDVEVLDKLGYDRNPFRGSLYETGDMARVRRIVTMAVNSNAMMSVVGPRGIGKSEAVESALRREKVNWLIVAREDQENLKVAEIKKAMISHLSNENMVRGGVASRSQLKRIIGENIGDNPHRPKVRIAVVLEEAQRLHASTLRSLKTLREIDWCGQKELFSVILLAHSDPMNRSGVSEAGLRSDCVRMTGLSEEEAAGYVQATVGRNFAFESPGESKAIDLLAKLPPSRNYLELHKFCFHLFNVALFAGREIVTKDDVAKAAELYTEVLPQKIPGVKAPSERPAGSVLSTVLSRRTGGESSEKGAINA